MKEKKVQVTYISSWKIHEDGVKVPVTGYRYFSATHYKRYYNTLCLLAGVGGSARNMLDYFCERMDNNNMVPSNVTIRRQFIKDIAKWTSGKVVYSDSAVKKAIHTLVSKGLLLKTEKRGMLIVNPEYFFKDSEDKRKRSLKMILDFKPENLNVKNETSEKP